VRFYLNLIGRLSAVNLQKSKIVVAVGISWAVLAGAASAASLTTSGTWTDVDPDNTVGITGLGTDEISWGTPPVGGSQSGYKFVGVGPETVDPADLVAAPFALGTFTHNNFPISGIPDPSSITGATLNVDLTLDAFSTTFTFNFNHNETPNSGTCDPASQLQPPVSCPDVVTFEDNGVSSEFITLDGVDYNLTLSGFVAAGTSDLVSQFITEEGGENVATLKAQLTKVEVESVPEPASLLGLVAIGGVAVALKRKQQPA
jgi:hypothetical protein